MRGMVSKSGAAAAAAADQNNSTGSEPIVRKGPWMPEEDEVLLEYVRQYGPRDWSSIRSKGLLPRTGKSCRLRWVNKLKPDLKSGCKFSPDEERMVVKMQAKLGNKWAKIASYLPGRTDNDVKNFWSTRQKRILRALQRPRLGATGSGESATAGNSDGSSPSYVSKNANELTAFQVPSNFEAPFYFGDEEHQSFVSREIKAEAADLHGFEQHVPLSVAADSIFHHHHHSGFMPEPGFHKPSAASSGRRRSSKSVRRERYPLEQHQHEFTIGGGGDEGGMQLVSHHHHRHHPVTTWRANDCMFGVNFFANEGAEFDFLIHPETLPASSSCMQQGTGGVQDFPPVAHQWEKLPVLYSESECSATSFPETAATAEAEFKCSKAIVDSCSPDSVLANLPGDVFDCLEPLCPGPAEWWVNRAG